MLCNTGTSLCKAATCSRGYCSVREWQRRIFHPRQESRTHLSLHSDFTVCLAHLVLLQWLQAETGKDSVCNYKSQASPWLTALHACASGAAFPSKLQYIPEKNGQWWDLIDVHLTRCYTWSNLLSISIPPHLQTRKWIWLYLQPSDLSKLAPDTTIEAGPKKSFKQHLFRRQTPTCSSGPEKREL